MTTFRPHRQRLLAPRSNTSTRRANAFTLVEILVVIGIILLLSAILFPAFKGIQERGAQTTCASNMQQIYLAVRLYKDDEREYPSSLAALLPDSETLEDTATSGGVGTSNVEGTGYFRKTREELVCPDDDFQVNEVAGTSPTPAATPSGTPTAGGSTTTPVRSSYGDTSNDATKASAASSETVGDNSPWKADGTHNDAFYKEGDIRDWGRLAWNYWGYDDWGQGFRTEAEAIAYFKSLPATTSPNLLRDPTKQAPVFASGKPNPGYAAVASYVATPYFNPRGFVTDIDENTGTVQGSPYEEPRAANMFKYSLSNPQAPLSTIITHCSYHRLLTGNNVITPGADQLYNSATSGADGTNARDIVLRLDGTARSYDITKWNQVDFPRAGHGSNWQVSDF